MVAGHAPDHSSGGDRPRDCGHLAGCIFLLDESPLLSISISLTAICVIVVLDRRLGPQQQNWLQGARGERAVGSILEEFASEGWLVLHGASPSRGDIDHILIGPGGLFTVETKSRTRPIRIDRIDSRMLKQAYAQRKVLERITGYRFEPLLVFSDAWLIGRVPARREGVTILSARVLRHYISKQRPVVTQERAAEVHRRLALALADD